MRWVGIAALLAGLPVASAAQTYLVVVAGLGGEPRYRDLFHDAAVSLIDAAVTRHGVARERVIYLAERPDRAPDRIAARSTKEVVGETLADLAGRAEADALIVIVLLGHGSETGGVARINLPGPDLTAAEFGALLDGFPTQRIVVANTTSASGGWVEALSAPGRVILTATRSGVERDESYFARHFTAALAGDGADTDKNGRVSMLEAFEYARIEVAREYASASQLQTEHALLDDNGDGRGSLQPDPATTDGALAARVFLASDRQAEGADPALAGLIARRDSLERELEALRARREAMAADAYERALEDLLLEVARVGRSIREHGERSGGGG